MDVQCKVLHGHYRDRQQSDSIGHMTAPKYLSKAPIKEALIDIQVSAAADRGVSALDVTLDGYPNKQTLNTSTVGLHLDDDAPNATLENRIVGYRYESTDGARIAQFRTNGFTFSQLEPYTRWEDLKAEAQRLWRFYAEAAAPEVITRVATRYINILRIPFTIGNGQGLRLGDFLTAAPQIPANLPLGLTSFLTRVVLTEPTIEAVGIITQALENIEDGHAPIILDIDVFMTRAFDSSTSEHWDRLEDLRAFKNRIFFESITDSTVGLFQ